ncbi:hyperosmolarity resistance protein Ebh [Staphylococcus aureus]|uniref:hyperosmolarity resistance protein Ebh n=1 Tax=Staphylococcus aureus TaxID=1280 RepID=UPI00044F1BF2|nr:hyperosmolarity resistance protein Ebh [Staphylococcus aureus]EVT15665.1 extracellular matrix-binding protein ebhA [Staphylococcus aureus M1519]
MNYRDKIQKFSIRKYTVGTFSTVIATLVFLGFNTSQAHAAETNQPASVVKQKQQSNNEQTENRESQVQNSQNSQNSQSLSATHENEQPNNSQANLVNQKVAQSSTTNDEQPASQNVNTKKDSATAATTQPDKEESKHKQNESQSANKNGNDNRAAHVENHEANVVTASDSSDNGNVQHDRNELQAFFDANYHDYRFIDRENADSGTFNYVKGIFDKINTLLGSNDPINNKDLQLAYKELEQAVALIRTMPQRQQTSRRSNRIQTRSVESRAAEPRSVSDYQNANSSYYVENANDGSGYPVGTYINASSKGAPYNLPTTPWNTLKASDSKEIALMTAKQTGDGYQWVIKFNKGHAPHQNMIFWFALPADQVPVGRTDFVTVNSDGTNVQWSHGAGAGANKPLQQMWEYGVNDPDRSHDFKIRNRSGQVIYSWPTVHVYSLEDLSRASDYFSEAGATPATKAFGRQNFEYINGQKPAESPGVPKVYTFIGQGDASYTISFKTQGPTVNKLYYAAGGRALEYNQLFMYSQLYVESTQDHQQRLNGLRQVVNRTYRIGTTKRVEVSQGNVQTKKVLESTNLNIDDFVDDPLSYVKTPSNKVLGFYPTNANTNAFRPGGVQELNEYQLSQLFTDQKLQEAARTRNPIRLMIGFDYPDGYGNSETLVPVNLTVLPEIQHNIKFFKNDDTQNIAEKPFSKQAGHPVFYVYAGNQGNASVNLGGSVTSIQPLRINLTSNENFTDKGWQITGIPRTLHIENSTNRTNNARERNIELVGNLLPGDYFGTIRFGRKEQLFEIRVKPHTPTITTTAEQLRGTALQKVPVNISGIPLDPSALVYLVAPTNQTTNGGSEADQIPSGYTILATGTPDGVHNTVTIRPQDYVVFIPPVGKQIRAVVYYNKVVASNMSNAVTILPDDIPPTINNPVGINAKYYRGDEVNFTMGVSDRHSGIKNTTITTLPSGWTSNLTKSDNKNGSLAITGRVSMNQAFNSDITFKVSATDNVNNTTNDSQSKHVSIHVGKISEDAHPIVLGNTEKVVVVNPTAVSNDEKQSIITAFMNKNQNIRGYLASTDPVTVDNNGNVTLHYRDGSSTTLDATNVMTYEPVVKSEYQTANAAKTATVTIAKGQSFNIGDIKQYFTLSNGQAIPNGTFTNITSDRTIPTAQEVSQMNAGTQLYHIVASNAYHKDTEDFYISLKIVDVKQPEGDQRVYRTSTYDLTTDEISKVKQAFINANRDVITLAEGDISVTNTPNGANVSTITVNINKGRLTKSFASNLANMNFLRWVNFPQDYTVTWTNAKIANRPTDGGLSWSDDHKSLIYRYDATLGTQITTNDILTMLKATTTVPGLRNNITGNEKAQAEAGGRPNYRTTGYSQSNATTDGQRQFTLNGQVIQILDIINPSNGYGGQPVTNSNTRANHSNSTVVNVNEPAANGAGAFTIDHVVKSNSTHNASDAVYKAQLYLTPYGPKQYVEHLNQNTGNTTDAINIYFVPSDLVNPTISVGNYTNHQVFSGETFTNTITANDNFGVQSVTVPNTSQITGTVDNNHQHVSATAPNVTSATSKTINLLATDTSGNTATTSFNVTVKPLRDKYRVGTSSTAANPVRIANISNNATVSQADQTTIINSLTFTSNAPNRNYATASANEITSKTVSNVSRTGNNANVTVTVTHQDGTTSTVTVPVKHVIPEIVAHSHYTVQGQDFPAGNGSSAADYFKLSNGSAIPDATITWVSGQAPNKDNTRIGEDITVTAHILIDGETTPITKTATYKVVRTVPKHVFETARGVLYPGVSDMYDAKQYVKPVNNSWSTNAQHMNFQFVGTYGPNKDVVGISTRLIRVTYDNRQTEDLTILSKVKPDPPRIDANSVTYKAGLTNQEIKVNNVLNNSSVKLFKADNTPLNVTNITHGSGFSSVVTVSDALPNGGIKAKSSISMNNVTYTTQDEHGQVVTVTRNESVDSNDSASVTVTPQLQATTEGAVFIKGGDGFDFGHVERFIQNPPHGATVAWHDSPDTWKNTVGNTHKTAVVTLPSGQGTRNVEVPVKVYPVANAKAPSRDVKGQNLTHGTNAIDYITFDPNTNTNGITAAWANRQQPNNQQAGVQHLNVDVTYPGISAAKRVPVTVNVYQFEFPQTTYTTTVGGTLASGTQASGYAHMQNASGLPTDGFTYKWNRDTTGTNDANWAAMNKPNTAQVVNAKYDVIYNGHTFATSLPAKFVVKDVQPAKPTVTETAAGAITIAPGANQTVNTHAGNVTTYADKLVIKRNGNVVTTFTRRNNTSPWVKEASADNVTGIVGTNNGITVAAGTFNPADTIQVVATQGSGETISDEQRSDDFTVVAPQPNQATTKIWQNGHIDITPNNPSGHLINPTQAMDIAYTEKVGNGAEHSKTINVVRGQNNQWTIANKPDYVTLDAQTGKVTFNANTIKPNSSITITPKAGTGHSVSSNPSTLTAPAAHTVNTTEIVKDYGSNVTAAEINNAVQVANKRTATIKNGTAMPTNLAGGSTTTIPVTVTYNDGSTEEVQESIFTKADKRELITAKNHLDDPVSTEGKKPGTITQYNNAMHNAQQQINTAKTEAQQVINNERATPQQVSDALTKVRAAQTKIDQAKALLQNKEDNSQLVTSKNNLQSSVNQVPSTAGMTQQSIDNYNAKKREAETEITAAQRVIDNGDATAQQISDEKHRVDNALTALNQAKHDLTADTHALEQAVQQLNRTGTTTGKKPASITAYNNSIRALQSDLTSAKNSANAIIQKPIRTVQEVQSALTNVNRVNERLTQAINQLVPLADNSALRTAKTKLDEEINKSVTTDGMTQSSIQAYENAKRAGQTETTNAQNVINNGDATDQQIAAEKTKVEEKYNSLKQAIAGLTPDLAPLQTAKTQLQNDIDQPTSTTGMTSASVAAFNDKLSAARTKIQEIDRVLASHPDVATIRQNVTAANAAKTALDQARNGLTVDKAPLENAKNQLQHSIDTQTSTTGMTQDSINAYNAKLTAARNKVQQINQVLAGSPTVDQINTNTSAANQAKSDLDHARQALTPDKAPLQNAKTQLEQSINQPTDTTGMTTASLNAYNQKLQAARQKLTEINQVLNGNPTVQNINDKVAEANQAKDQLNTARQGLTLDRQPALTTLHGASNLNQAQQNNFTQQINAAQNHAALETIKSNITALNTAMTKLKDSVADNNTIKSGQNYTDATPANKQAYDNAVNAAKGVIGETTNPTMDVNTVNQKAASVKSTKDALDGQQNLQRAKTEATNAITHASDLNQAQKNALTQQVNSAQNVQAVNDIKQTTQSLNTAMTGLKRGVANHNQVVQSDNYVNADTNKKNDYNNAYNHANDIINGNAQHPVITPSDVNNALSNVTSKEHALNGEAKLNAAKQEANTALGHLNNLNNVQRQNLQSQINGAHQIDAVNTIKQNATNLNSAMGNLRQAVADKDQVKRTEDYADADTAKQNAYNNAVAAAETIINANSNPEMNPSTITQKAEQVNSSKTALNGDENLATAKQNAKTYLNTLTSITDAQKNNLISQISSATRVSGVDTVKQNAQHLDQAMANLQNGINNESQVKSSEKYRDADTNKQQEYDNAITAAKAILNKSTGPNTAQNAVEAALQRVNTAKDALNGDAKLIAAQNAAKQHLGTLTHITTAQRNDLTNQISQATNLAGVESVKQSANSLDGAMGNLQTAINDKSGTLASQNFLDADEQKRNAYNQAISAAETILNKQTGPNTAKTAVEQALNNVNSAKHALNGTQNLNNAKQAAITAINGASDLNQKQKDALKAQANGAQRVSNANDVQRNATELNTAMGQLQHAIADKTNTLASSKYVNADSTKQNAYTTKVTNAEHIISGTPTVVTTPSEVTAAANQVNSAKQELNGDERLRVAKQNANTAIDALTQLNTPQKAKLKEQVGQANRLEDVQSVQTNGQSLNNAMKGLRYSIANETTVKASQNYTDASPNNQSTYNSAVSNAKGIINQTNNPTMDTSAITQATTQVNNAKNGLNGAENLRNAQNTAKQNLNTLSHLTNNQKSAISSQIDRAGHVSEVTAAKNAATELNAQMGNLEQAIHDQNTVKQGVNFTDADKAKRDAYTNAVSRAETILNKTQGANTSKQDVEAAIQNVTSAKNALNGDQNVTNAKNAAKNALNNLTSINNAQKRDLTTKIDQATTVAGVEAVSNTGTQLNTAMANLQNGINDKANTLASENYHDADSDKKTAYTQAVTNAENILNKNSGSNLDKAAVENALSQVTNAKGALNGNHNLEQAKSNANTTINGLQHLTTAQKDKLKQQVQQAQNVAGVDTVKSSANTLNGAMGTLRNSIQDNTATKNGQNYLDATERNKTNYNNAVDSANGVINATSNPNMDANAINQIATQVTSTKNALDGTHNLTQAKQTATNAIDGATNLNKAQKDALKAQVTSAQRVANVTSIQQTANELNTAMGQLQHGIDDENATKQTQKYRDAEQSKKTAYDQAVAAAKAILNKQTGSNSDKAAVDRALQQVTSTKDALNGDAKLAEAKAAARQNLGTLNHITNAQRTALEGQINQATTVDGVNTVKTNANTLDGAMNSLQGAINDKDATLRNQNYLDADESKRNAYTQAVTAAEGILNKQTGGNTSKADVDNALNAVTRAKAALNGAENLRNAKTSATNTINGLPNLTQLQKDNLKHQVEQAQNVVGVNGVKDKGNTLNTAMGALRTSIQNDNTTKTSQNYLDASDSNKNNYNTAVNNANGVINATNNPNMDANAINDMANQVNTTKAALNGAQNLAQAKTNATNTINNAQDLNQKQKDALKTQVNNAQRVSDANNVQHTATELNGAMTALKAAIADKERTKASGNYVNADQEKRQAYDSKVTNAENIINGTPNATLTVNDVNSAASQVNAAKTALNGDNNLRVAKEHANNTIDGLAQLNNVQKAKLKEQVQSATTLDGVQTVKNSSQTLNTAMKGLRDSIANEATIKAGQNYTDASPNNRNEYDSAVTAAKAIINQTSNPTMEPNTITQATSQVTTKEHALNGAQNLAQAKTTAKNNLNNLTSINNAQKDALTRNIDGATTVAGVNQETAKATELNNAMHSLQNGINDETQTKQTQKYLDAEPSKKSAYDQAVNAAKAILTKASGQNVDKAAVEQALQNVNSTKTALNGDAKLNEAKAAAKQTLGTLTHINNAQRNALDNEITQATNVEGVNTVKAKAQQLDGAMGQLETSIRDKDTTLQSQNYQDADDAKRTAYSQAVNAAATILNKTAGGNTPKADVERAMQAVTQANTALNGIQNLERAKQAANTAITNASDLNTKQKEALKAQVTSAGRVSAANGVEHTATELNTAMTALKRAIADKADTKASGNYVNADANKRQAYDEKVTAAEHIVSGTPTPTLTPSDVTNAATQVTNAKTQLNGNHNLEVAKQNANTAIDGLTSLNGPQKAKLKEQVGQATTLPNVQTVRDNAQTLNTAMKGLRDSIANEATIKAGQNYTDASQNKQNDYNNAVTAAKAIIGQTTSPSMIAQEINQAKDQVTAKQQALNGQENLRTAQTNAKQHLNGLSDLTNAQKDAAKRQIEGATHVNEVTQAQNNADALNTAMTNLKNGIQDQNTIKQGVNFTDADEAKRNAYTNAVTQAEQILNKAQGPNTAKDGVETALQNVQRAKNELNGNQNVANAKTTAKNALNNLTSINNAQKAALKSQIEGATTVAGVNQVSTMASELNTAMSNLQRGINDEAATKAAQKYTEADRDKQTAYNDAVTAAKTLLDKTAGSNDNKVAVEQALQRVNTAKTALNGDARLNEAKNTAKQQLATMSHLTNAQKANLTEQIERGTTVAGVQGIQANAGTLNQAMNQLRQSIASKDATKSSEDYQDANADLQNAYNDAVTNAEGIISATNNPEMNPDTINQKASQVNSAKSALNGDEKLAAAKQTAKSDIGRLTDLNNAQRTAANAEVDQAPNLAAVTAAKNKATSLNTAMGNLKHALAEKDNTKRSVNYTDADQPKQQAYDTAVTQAEAITNANGSNANETQVQAALNQLNQAKNDLNGDNKVAQAKETAKRALASYSNLNNAQSTAATSQIDNATTVADVTAAQNTANELNTAMGQLQNGINDQNTVKQQVNFTDADQGKKDAYTNAVTNAQGILDKANGQNMTKAQVEAALNQVTTAKNALNGDANVRQAKSDAKANLGTLTHLNNAQKQDLTSQIEGATTVNGVNSVKTKAQDLDGAMQRLESAIANKDQTKASENYIDADPTKKTAFDNAITQAESYLNKDHGTNKDKQAVEQAIQSVTSTENALNGDANLQCAKTEATQAIDNLTQLNTPQKTALKQQVNAAQRVSGVTDLKNSATSLNNAMDQLKQAIGDHDTIVAGGNYTNASPDKQGAYTDAYNAAKNIVNGSPNVITNAADVTAATQRVNNAETSLNGDTNLATAKQQAKDALRQMTHLSDAQKQSITGQIDSATQVTGVQSVKDNATNLDNAMNQLRNSIANKDEVKASQPYVDADTDKQNAYNTAVTSAENIINATSQPTLDPSAVTQAANQVNTNKTALNGAQNLANKKQETTANINRLSHLNNAQKQDLNTQVTNAPNISTVNQVKTKAEQLDQAMERLINGIQDKDQVKQSVNFTDADPEKQTAYNNAVTAAENIINQANGTNANQSQVEAALSTVTTTKQALNGDRKVTDAKNNANQTLSTLDNLNNAQKGAVTGNINQAHTVAEVTQAIQTAQELNTAMGNLKNSLNDKDTTLGSQNFADADPEKKNAIKALANAKRDQINSNPDLTPEQKAKALKEIDEAEKRALQNVENAQTIDQLNRGLNLGLDDIRNTHVWEVDEQPAVNEIFEATPEQILVNGELIVHRDDIITEQDILAHINLIDQLSAEVIDTPSTATISDSLTAKVEVTLLDGSKVIVNVPVKVVEKELSVVKQQAIESIENAAQQKIDEINNSVTLTLEQKEAAIAEVNKLKQQAIDHVNNAPDVHSVEEIQQQEQAYIEQFNPEQFTIEQAKSNAIKSIEDAIQHMIDEIKARTDLTDKEKQEAIAKLNQLKEQAIQAIQRAQSISEITEQLEQFKAQMKAANPTAKELAKRKQEAISRIKDFSNEKINSIRNSEIGTADEKQAAMNQINEIVLETIRDINNAHTLQQVEAALNNGIARISAVQIVISDRAKQSSSTGNESNSHLTIGYGTANHPFNSSTIGHKKKLDEDDDIDPLHMRHFSNNFGNVIKNAIGVVGISGLLASFWFFIAKRRRKEDEEEELEIRDNNKDSIKETLDDTKHLPLLFAKRRRKEDEEDVTVEEKDSLNNGESLDKVKHTPFFLPKRRRKEDEEDVEVTNENTDEKVLKDNEHSPLLFAKRRKDKEEDVETTTSIESKDEDVPLLLAKKKNQKDNQSKDKKSASKNTSKKVAAKKKKKKSKKNKK